MKLASSQLLKRGLRGFTLIELLVVIGIISLLLALLLTAAGSLRNRAKLGRTRMLLEKLHTGLETYNLNFMDYPPDTVNTLTGSQALYYFLTTSFRSSPDATKGEMKSSLNMGPLATFDENEVSLKSGAAAIIDSWGNPVHFSYKQQTDLGTGLSINVPFIYSFGPNSVDDKAALDDLIAGRK